MPKNERTRPLTYLPVISTLADIYRDRVPFFLVVSESDLDPSELEEGESAAAIKQLSPKLSGCHETAEQR